MNTINNWCSINKLAINELKTKYMPIGTGKVEPMGNIYLKNRILGKVTQYGYLGMIIENKLNMDKQTESMYNKANKKLCIL